MEPATRTTPISTAVIVEQQSDAEIILPPPTPLNPIPSLPIALRVDNQEQLLHFLTTDPHLSSTTTNTTSTSTTATPTSLQFSQLLVFATEHLRTLLLRQVLSNPATRVFAEKKKNWDIAHTQFPFPKALMQKCVVVGTRVLLLSAADEEEDGKHYGEQQQQQQDDDDDNDDSFWDGVGRSNIDVITYFIRPSDLKHTTAVAKRIQQWNQRHSTSTTTGKTSSSMSYAASSSSTTAAAATATAAAAFHTHHRIVYLPQPTALAQKILHNHRLTTATAPNVSIHRLQLDVFPVDTDVLSLEYNDAYKEIAVEQTPSTILTTMARSLLKVQDICGKIPRLQSYGPTGEEVIRKFLNLSVEEYLARPTTTSSSSSTTTTPTTTTTLRQQQQQQQAQQHDGDPVEPGEIAACMVLDRKLDLVTPMISPLTYEGLLDDVVGIQTGFVHVPLNIIQPPDEDDDNQNDSSSSKKDRKMPASSKKQQQQSSKKKNELVALAVTSHDTLYAEVRDQHVEKFGSFLQYQAVALRESHANFTSHGKNKDLSEIHQFVRNIPVFSRNLRSLTNHIHLAELVKKTSEEVTFRERWQMERSMLEGDTCYDLLDDLVATQYPPFRFLRLLCLQSLCAGGIKSSRYDSLRRDVVQTYGFEFLFVLNHLEKAGLLRRRDGLWMDSSIMTSPFHSLRRSLILINAEVNTVEPDDISYVSSGYAPLSVRIIQTAVKGWTGRDDILREVGGRMVDVIQQNPPEDLAAAVKRPAAGSLGAWATSEQQQQQQQTTTTSSSSRKPILLVAYVGGVTYSEIAALRFLSKRPSFPFHIICITTKVINGTTFLKSLC